MKVNKISPDIYEIEDFVSAEEQQKVLDFARSLNEEQWWISDSEEYSKAFFYGKEYNGKKPEVFDEINNKVKNLFESLLYVGDVALQRYKKDAQMQTHTDYWLYDEPYHIRFGICIYYNDEYSGGEIQYPELGIVHKPKARSLVIHGGNILHANTPVTSDDIRYFSTCFVRGSKESPVVLNQDLFREVEETDGTVYR